MEDYSIVVALDGKTKKMTHCGITSTIINNNQVRKNKVCKNVIHKKLHEAEWNGSETVWHDRSFVTEPAHLKVPPGVHT